MPTRHKIFQCRSTPVLDPIGFLPDFRAHLHLSEPIIFHPRNYMLLDFLYINISVPQRICLDCSRVREVDKVLRDVMYITRNHTLSIVLHLSRNVKKKTCLLTPNKGSNQPAHPHSLICLCCPHEETLHPK